MYINGTGYLNGITCVYFSDISYHKSCLLVLSCLSKTLRFPIAKISDNRLKSKINDRE